MPVNLKEYAHRILHSGGTHIKVPIFAQVMRNLSHKNLACYLKDTCEVMSPSSTHTSGVCKSYRWPLSGTFALGGSSRNEALLLGGWLVGFSEDSVKITLKLLLSSILKKKKGTFKNQMNWITDICKFTEDF